MKIKPLILGLLLLTASAAVSLAGPRVSVSINTGGAWCPPVRPYCPPVAYCPPRWYGAPSFTYYPWGTSMYVSSSAFTTVSPVMNYASSAAPVYQVPAPPILPAQPVVVYPTSPFGWKR